MQPLMTPSLFSGHTLQIQSVAYGHEKELLFTDIHLQLTNGDFLLVTGDNGSGKSTFLRLTSGLLSPKQGHIFWDNQPIEEDNAFLQQVHYLSHQNGLKPLLTVEENIQLMFFLQLSNSADNMQAIKSVCDAFSLTAFQKVPVKQLSQGQQRRVALAKLALIKRPLWILDEPLTALDTNFQLILQALINQHLQDGGIAIISSHHSLDEMTNISHRLKMSA